MSDLSALPVTEDPAAPDASLADDATFQEALARPNHAAGMMLSVQAVRAEQAYHRRRLTRHAYWLHGSGTVAGLRVSVQSAGVPDADTPTTSLRVRVAPGIALDGLGREVVVDQPYVLDLAAWLTVRHDDPARWAELERDAFDPVANRLELDVTLRQRDIATGLQPVLAEAVNAGSDPVLPARRRDEVLLELMPARRAGARRAAHWHAAHRELPSAADAEAALGAPELQRLADAAGTPGESARLRLGARLLGALDDDARALLPRGDGRVPPEELARTLLARVHIELAVDAGTGQPRLVVNPLRTSVDNLARPFVLGATALAALAAQAFD